MLEKIILFRELHNEAFLFFIFLIFASVGSFLNVVIYRLPKILDYEWMQDAEAFLKDKNIKYEKFKYPAKKPNLNGLSHCPQCGTKIPFYYNIPILGWVLLRGKTACCKNTLPFRYPLVELTVALLGTYSFATFDIYYASLISIVSVLSVSIFFIDKDNMIIPDSLLFLLFVSILTYTGVSDKLNAIDVLKDMLITFAIFYGFSTAYEKIRGFNGMGFGDIKLISMMTGLIGLIYLPVFMLVSVFAFIGMLLLGTVSKNEERFKDTNGMIPFGPAIVTAGLSMIFLEKYLKYIY